MLDPPPCSAFALLGLHGRKFFVSDKAQLCLHGEEELLVLSLFFLFFLPLKLFTQLLLCLLKGLLDFNLLLLLLPLFPHGHTLSLHIQTFDNLIVPEVLYFYFFILLRVL